MYRLMAQLDLDRPIYTLGVASEMLDAHPRTLMVYEQLDMIKPQRTPTNRRRYSQRDVMKLQAIQKLTRRHGCNLGRRPLHPRPLEAALRPRGGAPGSLPRR
jgi:MerR family transcriptional regulator, heat shock protein HspR